MSDEEQQRKAKPFVVRARSLYLRPEFAGKDLAKLVQEWDDLELIRRMRRDELAFQLKSEMD